MRTLFIGNSHTYFNDMPKIFADICRENGVDMQVTMLTQGCMVAPVGEKWWAHIHEHPEIDLYYVDRRHPSAEGSGLSAKTIYDTLFIDGCINQQYMRIE